MKKSFFAIGFTLLLVALGTTDALLTGEIPPFTVSPPKDNGEIDVTTDTESGENSSATDTVGSSASSSEQGANGNQQGVTKQEAVNVGRILTEGGFEVEALSEPIFLARIIPPEDGTIVTGAILLKDGDRVGILAWSDSPKVKLYFLALKEALHQSFTPAVTDLVDEVQHPEGKPTRNFLSFLDTGISEERMVFVRVRERLYEMHIAEGKDDIMFDLLDSVSE